MRTINLTKNNPVMKWLLKGDPSIRWQVLRDIAGAGRKVVERERNRVARTGWGARLLAKQEVSGRWGGGLYSPKWTSTTYTMLLLWRLGLMPGNPRALNGCKLLLENGLYRDGGINFFGSLDHSETCVTGMILSVL